MTSGRAAEAIAMRSPWFIDDRLVPEGEDLFAHNAGQDEAQRLFRFAHNRLELLRTRELLQRQLPLPPAAVLDVGGCTGVHAAWLAGRGYRVQLVDIVPQHVRAAAEQGLTAEVGDARRLTQPDASQSREDWATSAFEVVVSALPARQRPSWVG